MIVAVTMDASVDSFLLALKDLGTMGLGITDPVRDPKAWDIKHEWFSFQKWSIDSLVK